MTPRIEVRNLPSPLRWGSARPGMAWHHVIPFSLLRNVWNRLVDQHIATQIPEARVAIRHYLLLADRNLPEIDSLVDRVRAENVDQRRASHNQLRPLDVSEANHLMTAAVWPAWNAVEGPRQRSDDPADRYFDRFTSGLTADEAARMKAVESLFSVFESFVGAGPTPGPESLRGLAEASARSRTIVACGLPIYFRPDLWIQEPDGRWRKRRGGEP